MKTYEGYLAELEELKAQLKGAIFYLALPAAFLPDADGYFLMVTPKGMKHITQQKWDEVAAKEDTEKYVMPQLSPKMEWLYFENTATYMPERKWKTIANAAKTKNGVLPSKMRTEDQRLYEYLTRLLKNERLEFIATVDSRRKANVELKRKYEELQAQREAEQVTNSAKQKAISDQHEIPENESAEERVARISSMIAADFGDDDFQPFW